MSEFDNLVLTKKGDGDYTSYVIHNNIICIYVIAHPTGNCQLSSIAYFQRILYCDKIEDQLLIMNKILETGKSLYLIDINQAYNGQLDNLIAASNNKIEIFQNMKHNYVNKTGNKMMICILEIKT